MTLSRICLRLNQQIVAAIISLRYNQRSKNSDGRQIALKAYGTGKLLPPILGLLASVLLRHRLHE